jgi:hypothetical protein
MRKSKYNYKPQKFKRMGVRLFSLAAVVLLIVSFMPSQKAKAAIAFDANLTSTPAHDNATSSSISTNTTSAAASNSKIIVVVGWWLNSADDISSVSGGGLTWNVDVKTGTAASGDKLAIVSADAPSGLASGTTITANFASALSGGRAIAAMSFTGVATGTSYDGTNNTHVTATANWTGGSLSTSNATDLIVGFGLADGAAGGDTSTPSTNYSEVHDWNDNSASEAWESVYRIVSALGPHTPGGTFSAGATDVWGLGVAYKAQSSFPTTSVLDTFNRSDGSLGSNWTSGVIEAMRCGMTPPARLYVGMPTGILKLTDRTAKLI